MKESDFKKVHRTKWHDFLWKRFLKQFPGAKSKKAINAILSDYEKRLITKRLATLVLIREGVGTREIGRVLWLSRATISALKKNFFGGAGVYKSQKAFKKSLKDKGKISDKISESHWLDDIFDDIDLWELIKNPPRPPGIGLKQ